MADNQQKRQSINYKEYLRHGMTVFIAVVAAVLVITRFDDVLAGLKALWQVAYPLLLGAAVAYLLNLVMKQWESIYFPRSNRSIVMRTRRPACLLLAVATIVAVVATVVAVVQSEMAGAIDAIKNGVILAANAGMDALGGVDAIKGYLGDTPLSFDQAVDQVLTQTGGAWGLLSSAVSVGGSVAHVTIGVVVALVFAIYLLLARETVCESAKRLGKRMFAPHVYEYVYHACSVANECFSRFITGQCFEAVILALLCTVGLHLFGFPYASSIGLCVGATSLVPLIGAWIGGVVGVLMILSVSPIQAVWFVVFLLVLQQIEGHFIYPNVVGSSVGVPGVWVLVAVFVGGGLFGVVGILLGVPVVATARRLVIEHNEHLDARKLTEESSLLP